MSEHLRGFLWVMLLLSAAIVVVPQLVTRSKNGDRLFDPFGTRGDESVWIDRGIRFSFAGLLLALATILYLTSS